MTHLGRFFFKLIGLFRNTRIEEDLSREIASHLALLEEDFRRQGMPAEEAHLAARRTYGGVETPSNSTGTSARFCGSNALCRTSVSRFASSQIAGFYNRRDLTLALGIGAVTSVFSLVNGVLLNPFAFRDPDRLVVLARPRTNYAARLGRPGQLSPLREPEAKLQNSRGCRYPSARRRQSFSPGDHPQMVGTVAASTNLFRLLGVRPVLGRDLLDSDAVTGADRVVLLSYEGWRTLFQADPQVWVKTAVGNGDAHRRRGAAAGDAFPADRAFSQDYISGDWRSSRTHCLWSICA